MKTWKKQALQPRSKRKMQCLIDFDLCASSHAEYCSIYKNTFLATLWCDGSHSPRLDLDDTTIESTHAHSNGYAQRPLEVRKAHYATFGQCSLGDSRSKASVTAPRRTATNTNGRFFVPIHCAKRLHWYLAVIAKQSSQISVYDSMASDNKIPSIVSGLLGRQACP